MLSKLLHYESNVSVSAADMKLLMSAVENHYQKLGKAASSAESCSGGTLGVFFKLVLDGRSCFVKTHLPFAAHKVNLIKEAVILEHLYGDVLEIEQLELEVEGYRYTFLIMDELQPLGSKPSMDTVNRLILDYEEKLRHLDFSKHQEVFQQLQNDYRLPKMQEKASGALDFLMQQQILSVSLGSILKVYFEKYRKSFTPDKYIICHGDLSNKNILMHHDRMIIIDWEDAVLGIREYDFYYWLTFLDQREYYGTEEFRRFCGSTDACKYIMLLVVVLKCYLSVISGSYKNNKVSVDDRLKEILDLF